MTILLGQCVEHIRHALGGPVDSAIGARSVVQQAGNWITGANRWRFMERGEAYLDKRGAITLSAATWVEATRTLSLAAAFTNYTHLAGDRIQITGGTNTTLGFYQVVSRNNANDITLATSIGATATGIAASLRLGGVALPTDCAEIIALHPSQGVIAEIRPVGHEELLHIRTMSAVSVSPYHVYAMVWGDNLTTTNGQPVPRLEIYPYPTNNETAAFQLFYRKKWVTPIGDQERLPLPEFMEPLFLSAVRAVAKGWEEEDNATVEARLNEIKASTLFLDAIRYDGAIQPSPGMITGGAAQQYFGTERRWHRTDVVVEVP